MWQHEEDVFLPDDHQDDHSDPIVLSPEDLLFLQGDDPDIFVDPHQLPVERFLLVVDRPYRHRPYEVDHDNPIDPEAESFPHLNPDGASQPAATTPEQNGDTLDTEDSVQLENDANIIVENIKES